MLPVQIRKGAPYEFSVKVYAADGDQVVPSAATVSITLPGGGALPEPVEDAVAAIDVDGTITYTLVAANTGVLGENYRAVFDYTLSTGDEQHLELFAIVRFPLKNVVLHADLVKHHRDLADVLFTGQSDFTQEIEEAFEDVYRTIANRGRRPELLLDSEQLRRPVEHRALARIFAGRRKEEGDRWDLYFEHHQGDYESWLSGTKFTYDADNSGTISGDEKNRPLGQFAWRT